MGGDGSRNDTDTDVVELIPDRTVGLFARAVLLAAVTGAFSYVSFPMVFSPAPVTLQVLGVFLAGILLGPVWGPAAMVLYLAAGALGAPVFAGGTAGIGQLAGATAGYLWSFPVAAGVIGLVVHRRRDPRAPGDVGLGWLLAGMALGTVVIYTFGVIGLAIVLEMSPQRAVVTGALVFIPAELVKMAAAVGIVRSDRLAAA